jgi:hypothetical protein
MAVLQSRLFKITALTAVILVCAVGCLGNGDRSMDFDFDGIARGEAHVSEITVPRVRLLFSGVTHYPAEFTGEPLLNEVRYTLPVTVVYGIHANNAEVLFGEEPSRVLYTWYDEDYSLVYSDKVFEERLPLYTGENLGEYILRIDAAWGDFEAVYLMRVVTAKGSSRNQCLYMEQYRDSDGYLVFRDGIDGLLELYDLYVRIKQSGHSYDLQEMFSLLRLEELRFPFSDTVLPKRVKLSPFRGSVTAEYVIEDMDFTFSVSADSFSNADEQIQNGLTRRIATVGDVNIYTPVYEDLLDANPSVEFDLSVNGRFVSLTVSIPCASPDRCIRGSERVWSGGYNRIDGHNCSGEWVNRQTALDALMQFEFKPVF